MHDIAEFLSAHELFVALEPEELERLAERVEIEYFEAGATIFRQGEGPPDAMWVLRTGAVELRDDAPGPRPARRGRAVRSSLDALGAADRLGGRARESSLCYRLAAEDVDPAARRSGGAALRGSDADGPPAAGRRADREGERPRRRPGDRPRAGPQAARWSASPDVSLREAAARMEEQGRELDPGRPGRRRARDRHRPRPALAGGRGRTPARHARSAR